MNSSTGIPPPEERFYVNIVEMTHLIKKIVTGANRVGYKEVTPIIVDLALAYLENNYDKKQLIENFIRSSHPPLDPNNPDRELDHSLWDRIRDGDDTFFREKAFDIFDTLPKDSVDAFRKLSVYVDPKTGQQIINDKDRKAIIAYFHSFVKISIKYIHLIRQPIAHEVEGKIKYVYRHPEFFRGVDVLEHSKKWQINLTFSRI